MKNVFLATSFSHKVNAEGEVEAAFRAEIEALLQGIRKEAGVKVFCAIEDEKWQLFNTLPEVAVQNDLKVLEAADVLVALLDQKISAGVQFEIGYAVAKGKQVILAIQLGTPIAYYNQGAAGAGWVTLITYADLEALIPQLTLAINAPQEVLS
jgi:nucleoside 2-deoxyribosyltransferase